MSKKGGTAAFLDLEHALDLKYCESLGVNTKELIFSQPDYGEQALEIAEGLIKSGSIDIIVIDSVAALVPKAELEGEMGESKLGLHARLMSQALRKLTGTISRTGCCCIFINQLREKIGVMFGCFPHNGKVLLADGTTMSIGKIVNNKVKCDVVSYNTETGIFENKNIIGWFNNGRYENLIKVRVLAPHTAGKTYITVADDHTFITKNGEKRLSELKVGDKVLTQSMTFLNNDQKSLIVGGYLGDGSIRTKNKLTSKYRETHAQKQNDYCIWKANILNDFVSTDGFNKKGQFWFETHSTVELNFLQECKKGGLTCINNTVLDSLDLKALAIWYLDDGTFSGSYEKWGWGKSTIYCKLLSNEDKERIKSYLLTKFNIKASVVKVGLLFSGEDNKVFQEKIAPFCPTCMSYKINPKLQHLVGVYKYDNTNIIKKVLLEVPIVDISPAVRKRAPFKYDIQIEDNSNYFLSGVLVHNSPEVTTGGNALKFYASVRLDVRRTVAPLKDKEGDASGNRTKVKVVKNKMAPPFKIAEFDIIYGKGISKAGELIDIGSELGIVSKSGSWFAMDGIKLGQGRDAAIQMVEDNVELGQEIEAKVKAFLNKK